jgi:hypothetical protein
MSHSLCIVASTKTIPFPTEFHPSRQANATYLGFSDPTSGTLLLEISEWAGRTVHFQSSNMHEILEKCNGLLPKVACVDIYVIDVPSVSFDLGQT